MNSDATFEDAAAHQRARARAMSAAEKLAWLQSAQDFARRSRGWDRARKKKLETSWKYGTQPSS